MHPGWTAAERLARTEQPRIDRSRCTRARYRRSSCVACVKACPHQAIELTPLPVIDRDRCLSCRSCEAACPTAALHGACEKLGDWLARLKRVERPIYGCHLQPEVSGHVRGPCVGCFDHELLVGLAASLPTGLMFNLTGCQECPNRMAAERLVQRVTSLADWPEFPFRGRLHSVRHAAELDFRPDTMSRRDFFRQFQRQTGDTLQDCLREAASEVSTSAYRAKRLPLRRFFLLQVKERMSDDELKLIRHGLLTRVTFSEACISCRACIRACPAGALSMGEPQDRTPIHDGDRCLACGLCVEFCRRQAVTLLTGTATNA